MVQLRKCGVPPYTVAVLHGGPGASGSAGMLARELGMEFGVLEPWQTMPTIAGQIEELAEVLRKFGAEPVTVVGHSWGAWLGYLFTARYPERVRKLILVGCGPFAPEYLPQLNQTRRERLTTAEQKQVELWQQALNNPEVADKTAIFANFGKLMARVDSFDPLPDEVETGKFQPEIFESVMVELQELRWSGELLQEGRRIQCPVVAVHGDYDPHPADGVALPLQAVLKNFKMIRLERCGHTPWKERQAREEFYRVLKEAISI